MFKEKIMLNNVLTSIQRLGRVFIFPDVFRAPTLSFFLARTCLKSNEVKNNSLKRPLTIIKGPDVLTATILLTSFKGPYVYSRDRTSIYWQGCIFVGSSSFYRPSFIVFSIIRTCLLYLNVFFKVLNVHSEARLCLKKP